MNEANCHGRDWIELVNTTQAAIDIGGWKVADDLYKDGHQYALPAGTAIQPGEYLLVKQASGLEAGFDFGIKCGEDSVYLLDGAGALVDEAAVGDAPYGSTWGRLPDLTGLWRETYPTGGYENQAPL
jgi:hypothetical protein